MIPSNYHSPLVSVIIPAYNAEHFIGQALDSVFAQTFQDFEVLVIDDGSTDNTAQIVVSFGNRVRYIYKENGGVATARNLGIELARGQYIAFLDADDLWLPDKLQEQMVLFAQTPDLAWVYCDAIIFEETGDLYKLSDMSKLYEGFILCQLLIEDFIYMSTPVIHRYVFENIENRFHSWQFSEDWDLWLRIAAQYSVKVVRVPLVKYRRHSQGRSWNPSNFVNDLYCRLGIIHRIKKNYPDQVTQFYEKALAYQSLLMGISMLKAGFSRQARVAFFYAMPWFPHAYLYWLATFLSPILIKQTIAFRRSLWNIGIYRKV